MDYIMEQRAVTGLDLTPTDPEYIRCVTFTRSLSMEMDYLQDKRSNYKFYTYTCQRKKLIAFSQWCTKKDS